MKIFLFLILAIFGGKISAQTTDIINGREVIILSPEEGQVIEYWGRKGIASVPLVSSLDLHVQSLERESKFQDNIIDNYRNAQLEYRLMVERLAKTNSDLTIKLVETEKDRDIFKDRARQRGYALGLISTAAGILLYLGIKG